MNKKVEQLRNYGLQENRHLIATIFNPKSAGYRDLQYLEEALEDACTQAQRAFGPNDEIYLDARINAALFYWYRLQKYELASDHLQFAIAVVENNPGVAPELLAKLLSASALNESRRRPVDDTNSITGILSGTLDEPFGHRVEKGDFRSAVKVFELMEETARRTDHPVLSYLIAELGPSFCYELWTLGHRSEAVQILRNEVLADAVQTWGEESLQAKRIASEVRWLEELKSGESQISFGLVERARREMQDVFLTATLPAHFAITPVESALFEQVHHSVNEFRSAAPDQIGQSIANCETGIRNLLNEMQDSGEYAAIMNWTDSFLRAATDQTRNGSERQGFNERLSPDERDRIASMKVGDVDRTSINAVNPTQEWLSREHTSWLLNGCGENGRSTAVAVLILIPCLDVLASLYGISLDSRKRQKSLELRKFVLRLAHANCSDQELVSRMRVKLAQSLVDNASGDWDDLMRCLLVHTDSLDFSVQSASSYHAALGSALRAIGYWMRRVQSGTSSWVSKSRYPFMDLVFAGEYAKAAFAFFSNTPFTIEWAQLMHSQSEALITKTPHDDPDSETTRHKDPDVGKDEDNAEKDFLHASIHHLAAADFVLDPIHFTERWIDIQILRAKALNSAAALENALPEDPSAVLIRAKTLISHLEPSGLHLRLNLALASLGAIQTTTVIAELPAQADRAVASGRRYGVRTFLELCEFGEALFSRTHFDDAASVLHHALEIGERLFLMGRSLDSLRTTAHHLARVAGQLAYCCHRAGEYTKAVMALERGKARLLLASLKSEQIDWEMLPEETRIQGKQLFEERRQLIAQSDSSVAYIEDIDRLAEVQAELSELLRGDMDSLLPRAFSIQFLSDIPSGSVIALPLITEHGSAVYLVRSLVGEVCAEDVIHLPEFTSATLSSWLNGGEALGWLDAYIQRNRSRLDQNRFQRKVEEISRLAFTTLIGPICDRVRGHELAEIIFVAANGLQLLPLVCSGAEATEAPADGQRNPLNDFTFRTVPSATVLQILRRRYQTPSGKQGMVVGVSKYDASEWAPLPNATIEATIVADQVGVTPLLDGAATADRVSQEINRSKYVHIACHGASWATDRMFFAGWSSKAVLILNNDGLTTRDILSSWDLQGTQLVSLSACDTGVVDLYRPWDEFEGVSSLMLSLGAWRVIASLWSVDDKSTTLLMAKLYRNIIVHGMNPERALGQAQNWLRSATLLELQTTFPQLFSDEERHNLESGNSQPFAHPYFWASFVIIG